MPQYNPERGVVGKCDLCHSRLSHGQAPACVTACPSGAIQVEIVNIAEWTAAASAALPAPGMPVADQSISTTRITLPENLAPNARPVDLVRLALSEAHWSLIIMTTLTQLSVGALGTVWLLQLLGASTGPWRDGADLGPRRRPGAGIVNAAPRAPDSRVPRVEDVETVVAEP